MNVVRKKKGFAAETGRLFPTETGRLFAPETGRLFAPESGQLIAPETSRSDEELKRATSARTRTRNHLGWHQDKPTLLG